MSEALVPTVVTQIIATVSGAIVSVGIPLVLTKLNKINRLHTTVFGLQEVSTVGGLVESVEQNADNIETIESEQQEMKETQAKVVEVLKSLEQKIDSEHIRSEDLESDSDNSSTDSELDAYFTNGDEDSS